MTHEAMNAGMSDDLVRRLRYAHAAGDGEVCREAANTIERLQADARRATEAEFDRWVKMLRDTAVRMRENAEALRKWPDMEQEARARELAAVSVNEVAEVEVATRKLKAIEEALTRITQRSAAIDEGPEAMTASP